VKNKNSEKCCSYNRAGVYLLGEKSKAANWVLNHPFHICGAAALIGLLVGDYDKVHLMRSLMISASLMGVALIFRYLCRNLCYWVEIDTLSERIKFFRCFNRGIVEAPLRSVEFIFDKHFACLYRGERFTIFNGYMGCIVKVLPSGMKIQFTNGFYGRFMEKQFEKNLVRGASEGDHQYK
jgi:hypothetical protein